jgi:anti-sigma regulatory factor (Ser/Thr protein kinase)
MSFARQRITDDKTIQAIASCVTEAVTNVLLHAYQDHPEPGPVILEASFTEARLRIRVCDHGTGLTPRVESPGFGLGLPVISQLADEADFRTRKRGGTEVTMHFRVA